MQSNSTPSRKNAARPYLFGALFVWTLTGAVAWAAYSSRAVPAAPPVPNPDLSSLQASGTAVSSEQKLAAMAEQFDAPGSNSTQNGGKGKGITWELTFEGAMQRARNENKPLMIDFYTDWCSVCKQLDREVYPDKSVVQESKKWVSIRINAEKRPDVAGAYGVTGYPTIVFARKSGVPLLILPGMAPVPDFVDAMKQAYKKQA